jgi:hypothetical protein
MPRTMARAAYADMYGPTTGDRVRLADTDLIIEVEKDQATSLAGTLAGTIGTPIGTLPFSRFDSISDSVLARCRMASGSSRTNWLVVA